MKIYCRVTGDGLVPIYGSDLEEKRKLKIGSNVMVDITKPRNYEFHKKFFALIRLTFDNLNERLQEELQIYSEDDLLVRLKIDLKLFKLVRYGAMQAVVPNSISFASMDEYEFNEFYRKCTNHILNVYLAGVDSDQIAEELYRFL